MENNTIIYRNISGETHQGAFELWIEFVRSTNAFLDKRTTHGKRTFYRLYEKDNVIDFHTYETTKVIQVEIEYAKCSKGSGLDKSLEAFIEQLCMRAEKHYLNKNKKSCKTLYLNGLIMNDGEVSTLKRQEHFDLLLEKEVLKGYVDIKLEELYDANSVDDYVMKNTALTDLKWLTDRIEYIDKHSQA